jgi:hypothetical protein
MIGVYTVTNVIDFEVYTMIHGTIESRLSGKY